MSFPSFEEFYSSVHRRPPLGWQSRLAEQVAVSSSGKWPDAIGIPTGLGKTGCIDIALWALGRSLAADDGVMPRRIWYVVDRRLLVDRAFDEAITLVGMLEAATEGGIAQVANALRSGAQFGAVGSPVHIVRLRGGAELGHRAPDPSQPCLIFSTVAMYASRLLFRGYGTSRLMRSVDAALAGTDSLVLLDEAHLARPLVKLLRDLPGCDTRPMDPILPHLRHRPQLVSMTATGDAATSTFSLQPEDEVEPLVRQRLDAAKPVQLRETTKSLIESVLAEEALAAVTEPRCALVFCNTARRARGVFERVDNARRKGSEIDVHLLTGRLRPCDADAVRAAVLSVAATRPARPALVRSAIVVATQTLEVGADVDFDVLVTEVSGARSTVQRLGRLNRTGERHGAQAIIVAATDALGADPVYGDEAAAVWSRLKSLSAEAADLDLSPRVLSGGVLSGIEERHARVPEMLPAHLWEYVKTSVSEEGEPPVEPFFAGLDDSPLTASVVWRIHVPRTPDGDPERRALFPLVSDDEAVDLPLGEVAEFLGKLPRDMAVHRLNRFDPAVLDVMPRADDGALLSRIRPGDVVVLPVSAGGYDEYGWTGSPGSATVRDAAVERRHVLWLDPDNLATQLGFAEFSTESDVTDQLKRMAAALAANRTSEEGVAEDDPAAEQVVAEAWAAVAPTGEVDLQPWGYFRSDEGGRPPLRQAPDGVWLLQGAEAVAVDPVDLRPRADAFDDLSFNLNTLDTSSPSLGAHLDLVGAIAGRIAERLGMEDELVAAVRRAGWCHDLGKADVRFQRLLDPAGTATEPMAKSSRGRPLTTLPTEWPRGGRHEAISGRLLEALFAQRSDVPRQDLLIHLVLSHHGHGRPLVPPAAEPRDLPVRARLLLGPGDAVETETMSGLSRTDWGQPRRFRLLNEHFGYWGLALLEAVVRQADHIASAQTDSTSPVGRGPRVSLEVV